MAGIKRKEYLQYLANTRDREFRMKDAGYQVVHKSIKEIRDEFESKFGSIYIIDNSWRCQAAKPSGKLKIENYGDNDFES